MLVYTIALVVTATVGKHRWTETDIRRPPITPVSVNSSVRKEMGGPDYPTPRDARALVRGWVRGLLWWSDRIRGTAT